MAENTGISQQIATLALALRDAFELFGYPTSIIDNEVRDCLGLPNYHTLHESDYTTAAPELAGRALQPDSIGIYPLLREFLYNPSKPSTKALVAFHVLRRLKRHFDEGERGALRRDTLRAAGSHDKTVFGLVCMFSEACKGKLGRFEQFIHKYNLFDVGSPIRHISVLRIGTAMEKTHHPDDASWLQEASSEGADVLEDFRGALNVMLDTNAEARINLFETRAGGTLVDFNALDHEMVSSLLQAVHGFPRFEAKKVEGLNDGSFDERCIQHMQRGSLSDGEWNNFIASQAIEAAIGEIPRVRRAMDAFKVLKADLSALSPPPASPVQTRVVNPTRQFPRATAEVLESRKKIKAKRRYAPMEWEMIQEDDSGNKKLPSLPRSNNKPTIRQAAEALGPENSARKRGRFMPHNPPSFEPTSPVAAVARPAFDPPAAAANPVADTTSPAHPMGPVVGVAAAQTAAARLHHNTRRTGQEPAGVQGATVAAATAIPVDVASPKDGGQTSAPTRATVATPASSKKATRARKRGVLGLDFGGGKALQETSKTVRKIAQEKQKAAKKALGAVEVKISNLQEKTIANLKKAMDTNGQEEERLENQIRDLQKQLAAVKAKKSDSEANMAQVEDDMDELESKKRLSEKAIVKILDASGTAEVLEVGADLGSVNLEALKFIFAKAYKDALQGKPLVFKTQLDSFPHQFLRRLYDFLLEKDFTSNPEVESPEGMETYPRHLEASNNNKDYMMHLLASMLKLVDEEDLAVRRARLDKKDPDDFWA